MTDNEIIKALEEWSERGMTFCNISMSEFARWVLDLINRQQAEIESLKKETEKYPFKCKVGNNSEIHSKSIEDYDKLIGDISAEAIREFAERLKDVWFDNRYDSPDIEFDYFVDNLVKEMVGEDNVSAL